MHQTVQNLVNIQENINSNLSNQENHKVPKIIAVSKTFGMDKILPLIEYGHLDFGENKVQEAIEKWSELKLSNNDIKNKIKEIEFFVPTWNENNGNFANGIGLIINTAILNVNISAVLGSPIFPNILLLKNK